MDTLEKPLNLTLDFSFFVQFKYFCGFLLLLSNSNNKHFISVNADIQFNNKQNK